MVFGLCPAGTEFYDFTKTSFELLRGYILKKYGSQSLARLLRLFLILTTVLCKVYLFTFHDMHTHAHLFLKQYMSYQGCALILHVSIWLHTHIHHVIEHRRTKIKFLLEHNLHKNVSKRPAFLWKNANSIEYGLNDTIRIKNFAHLHTLIWVLKQFGCSKWFWLKCCHEKTGSLEPYLFFQYALETRLEIVRCDFNYFLGCRIQLFVFQNSKI